MVYEFPAGVSLPGTPELPAVFHRAGDVVNRDMDAIDGGGLVGMEAGA